MIKKLVYQKDYKKSKFHAAIYIASKYGKLELKEEIDLFTTTVGNFNTPPLTDGTCDDQQAY